MCLHWFLCVHWRLMEMHDTYAVSNTYWAIHLWLTVTIIRFISFGSYTYLCKPVCNGANSHTILSTDLLSTFYIVQARHIHGLRVTMYRYTSRDTKTLYMWHCWKTVLLSGLKDFRILRSYIISSNSSAAWLACAEQRQDLIYWNSFNSDFTSMSSVRLRWLGLSSPHLNVTNHWVSLMQVIRKVWLDYKKTWVLNSRINVYV